MGSQGRRGRRRQRLRSDYGATGCFKDRAILRRTYTPWARTERDRNEENDRNPSSTATTWTVRHRATDAEQEAPGDTSHNSGRQTPSNRRRATSSGRQAPATGDRLWATPGLGRGLTRRRPSAVDRCPAVFTTSVFRTRSRTVRLCRRSGTTTWLRTGSRTTAIGEDRPRPNLKSCIR